MNGIDISHWQAGFNIENSNVDFCIVKATEGNNFVDPFCDMYIQQCINNDIPFGFYHFNRTNEAANEAHYFYNNVKNYIGKGIPILDYETRNIDDAKWVEKFMQTFYDLCGVWPMLYCSASWCSKFRNSWIPNKCGLWVAGYPKKYTTYTNDKMPYDITPWSFCAIWQFTNELECNGYKVDGDIAYMDVNAWNRYANKTNENNRNITRIAWEVIGGKWGNGINRKNALIKAGYDYAEIQAKVNEIMNRKSIETLAKEVIAGKWGNGITRKNALTQAGYDYNAVQAKVNEML